MKLLVDTNTLRHAAASYWEHQEDQLVMFGPWLIAHRKFKWRPKPQSETIARELPFVPALGMAGARHNIEFNTYQLLELEKLTVRPSIDWAGRSIAELFSLTRLETRFDYNGLLFGDGVPLARRIRRHVNGITDSRFHELVKSLGAKNSQDALHILVCEQYGLDGIVTLDGRLKRTFEQAQKRLRSPVTVFFPSEVCSQYGIEPVGDEWFAEGLSDPFTNKLVMLFQKKATRRDRVLYALYRVAMSLRDRFGAEVKFVIPGH
jgi:hypothetical protein